MEKSILNFHFDYWNTSLTISQGKTIWIRSDQRTSMNLANTTKSLQNCLFPKHLKLPQGPPGVPQWTPPQKYLQHNNTWAIVEVFTIIVFEKGKLLGERLARQVWNVDLDSTRHLDGLESGESIGAANDFESCFMLIVHLISQPFELRVAPPHRDFS